MGRNKFYKKIKMICKKGRKS